MIMRREDIAQPLSELAFEFFFWFSRFEYALKENGYLKSLVDGTRAEPGWEKFVDHWQLKYVPSQEARRLLTAPPDRQIVLGGKLEWQPVGLADCVCDLARIVRLVKTTRNNLFHGGKHGGAGWDDPKRTEELLKNSMAILEQLADLGGFQADYRQYY
ncbi:hypothetical protein AB4142_15060 [Variovorax sp. 2RAF20]|uniref:hypothetical protein n=1 Tax=Variovorax sp. CF313 TaxID=1144315 RepID=UPI00027127F0|nr:hypothetical protein [Variovorax sp. CF313]EJL74099.1 hypothetical protein PMI12_03123 [Variovorax sp. CF313]